MAFNFDNDNDWLFMFCKKCWDYKKFVFNKAINFEDETTDQLGKCVDCDKKQKISTLEIKEYYGHLNDHNN
ncbi:hypothetical protein ESOMN_v1c05240 [Williamsoniiplasma somnilux]|uniref:Uncharacterized protein n=1 Tax=Williamsoniiplasma somnilux TaxID=215578 RepID=A0A2K8NZC6_9MOLU|nr:hypothetical protein [Williamsoniiplasma somnilux]ATZ18906.1 hypothetical protein ESOMN_v1c05240 [Williamsoniiplasma somnilux]